MKIQKLENRTNEFTEQLSSLLSNSFINLDDFKLVYYIGKDTIGNKGLYFELYSKRYGKIYNKSMDMQQYQTIGDIEDPFIAQVINDILINGILLLNYNKNKSSKVTSVQDNGIVIYLN